MNGNNVPHRRSLLPHFSLLLLAGGLTGIVSQLSTWQSVTGLDPGYTPFILLVIAGVFIGAIAPIGTAALAGVVTGMAVAGGGLLYQAFTHASARDGAPTIVSYVIIMACLGAFGGFLGAIPARILRAWIQRDRDKTSS
jgi:hypothetical protein